MAGGLEQNNQLLVDGNWIPDDLKPAWNSLIPDLIANCRERIAEAGPVDTLRIHGDCHAGNILCRDETMLFVDLDDCRTGPAVQDMWLLLNGDASERGGAQLGELLEGYEMFRDFNRRERHLIEPPCDATGKSPTVRGWQGAGKIRPSRDSSPPGFHSRGSGQTRSCPYGNSWPHYRNRLSACRANSDFLTRGTHER